jgi:hypothetical protein
MRFFLFILMMALIIPSVARAQSTGALISGRYLMEICSRDDEGKEMVKGGHTACQAYIAGIVDYHNLLRSLGTAPSVDLCVPNTVKLSDLQDIVWAYLKENAHHEAFIAAPAVSLALFQFFPCRKPDID